MHFIQWLLACLCTMLHAVLFRSSRRRPTLLCTKPAREAPRRDFPSLVCSLYYSIFGHCEVVYEHAIKGIWWSFKGINNCGIYLMAQSIVFLQSANLLNHQHLTNTLLPNFHTVTLKSHTEISVWSIVQKLQVYLLYCSGIVNRTKSPLGSRLLKWVLKFKVPPHLSASQVYGVSHCRLWFLRPLRDVRTLKQRQDAVAFLASPRNEEVAATLHNCIKHIRNIPVSCMCLLWISAMCRSR